MSDTNEQPDDSKPAGSQTDEEILDEARDRYRLCQDAESDNRADALDDLRFLAGGENQWDPIAVAQRRTSRRPMITVNTLPTYLHQVTNDQRQNTPSIKVHPVGNGADDKRAKVRQGIIRHIEYESNADVSYDTAVNSAAAIGFGYFRVMPEFEAPESWNQKLCFKRIRNALSVKIDPLNQEPDGSGMQYCFIENLRDRADFKRQYPKANASDPMFFQGNASYVGWMTDATVLECEYYRIEKTAADVVLLSNGESGFKDDLLTMPEGVTIAKTRKGTRSKVMWYKITGADILERTEIKCKWIPVFPVYGDELDIEGKIIRSGIIRHAKSPAQMYNVMMPLSLDTPLPTPNGWTTMGLVNAGDRLFDENGQPCDVLGVSPIHINRECFRVDFDDGSHIVADRDHEWCVEERGKRKAQTFDWQTKSVKTHELTPGKHFIFAAKPLQMPDIELPLHPYFFGAWLGDGTSCSGGITCGDRDVDEMRETLSSFGLNVGESRKYGDKAPQFTVHGVVESLRLMGVLKNKHIPPIYLRASLSQRSLLLQGLMDTDGCMSKQNRTCSFVSTSDKIKDGICELLHSFGIKVQQRRMAGRVCVVNEKYGPYQSADYWILTFAAPEIQPIFRLARKAAIQNARKKTHTRRRRHAIRAVLPVPSVPVKCVLVSAESHLFLAGRSMIPTHNTSATEEVSLRSKSPYIMAEGQEEGHEDEWNVSHVTPLPFLTYKPTTIDGFLTPPPQRNAMADIPAGMLAMAMHASDNVKKTTGLFDASLGAKGTARSGVQEEAQIHEGDVANYHYMDGLLRTIRHAGRCIDNMIPKYYDWQGVAKIMREDGKMDSATINTPQSSVDEQGNAIQTVLNDMTSGDFDVTVGAGPSYSTMRQESADFFSNAMQSAKDPATAAVVTYLAMKNQDVPGGDEATAMLKTLLPPQAVAAVEGEKNAPMVQTAHGPLPIPQAEQAIAQMSEQLENMSEALKKADATKQSIEAMKQQQILNEQQLEPARQEAEKMKLAAEIEKARAAGMSAQADLLRAQAEAEALPAQAHADAQRASTEHMTAQATLMREQQQLEIDAVKAQAEALKGDDDAIVTWKAALESRTKIIVAEIIAKSKVDAVAARPPPAKPKGNEK